MRVLKYRNSKIKQTKKIKVLETKDIVVFVEKIFKYRLEGKKDSYYLLLDFPINDSHKISFFEQISLEFKGEQSMLEIDKIVLKGGGVPKEGSFYHLPQEFIKGFDWQLPNDNDESRSTYIALRGAGDERKIEFKRSLKYDEYVQDVRAINAKEIVRYIKPFFEGIKPKKVEVSVYDVGHGNWNEILFNDERLIVYDLGASSSVVFREAYNRIALSQNRNFKISTLLEDNYSFKKVLIISHWDVDHYNGVFEISHDVISSFEYCIVPNKIENNTTFRAYSKLAELITVFPIEMSKNEAINGRSNYLHAFLNFKTLKLYKGTKCNDRNKRGLLISLHFNNTDFIFPADHYYDQITRFIIPNCNLGLLNMVIPHHGGRAGRHALLTDQAWNNSHTAVISSGNKYGHPFADILETVENHFAIYRTDSTGDFNSTL